MKFKTTTEYREEPRSITVDGKTHTRMKRVPVEVPKLPRDWDQIAVRAAVIVVMGLTAVAIVWSTYSIGHLLNGGVGYAAATVFDAAWIVNVLLEYLGRFDPKKRARTKWLGWALLVCTMGAIFWDGMLADSVALGVVGAAVSLFAKVLWLAIMTFINKELSEDHQEWVAMETSEANAKIALAQVRRQSARAETHAALELLAAERMRSQYAALTPTVAAEPVLDVTEEAPGRDTLTLGQAVRAILADDGHQSLTPGAPMSQEAEEAIQQAIADGWTSRELYDAAIETRRATTPPRRRDVTNPETVRTSPGIRPETSGYPETLVSAQVNASGKQSGIRPDTRPEPETERVPEPRPASLAQEVKRLVLDGMTDASHIARALASRVDREPADPRYLETVSRYVRDAKKATTEPDDGLGRTYL